MGRVEQGALADVLEACAVRPGALCSGGMAVRTMNRLATWAGRENMHSLARVPKLTEGSKFTVNVHA